MRSTIDHLDKILTEDEYQRHNDIKETKEAIKDAEKKLMDLTGNCKHKLLPLTPVQLNHLREGDVESWGYDGAICIICESHLGWRCPDSPDGCCYYYSQSESEEGPFFVRLMNDEKYIIPEYEYSDFAYETDDCCIFCGNPDERK